MSNGYDNLTPITYHFEDVDFGVATPGSRKLPIPIGANFARVLDVFVVASEVFTDVTTSARVDVGDGTVQNKFASLSIGALADGSSVSGRDGSAFEGLYNEAEYDDPLHDLVATFVAPTGGTITGTADVYVIVGYDHVQG